MPYILSTDISVPVGTTTLEFKKGAHNELPEVAVCYAKSKKRISGTGTLIKNAEWNKQKTKVTDK